MRYDSIIIGGGSAGSVLAHRLSEDPSRQVLLIEAGPDMPHGKIPAALLDSYPGAAYTNPAYTWNKLRITTDAAAGRPGAHPRIKPYEQARVMGGGSSINAQFANRGSPRDYDEWVERGASGWSWKEVLPYFKRLEHDQDFQNPLHGNCGRLPIRRVFEQSWPGHALALAAALRDSGYEYLPDQNGEYQDGFYPTAINNVYERRVSASTAYLDPVTRQRANLRIAANTEVSRLLFEGQDCVGVEIQGTGGAETVRGKETIVSCGAIFSPALLQRSGIGDATSLRDLGIGVVADRLGVGRRLMDHPMIAVASFLAPAARVNTQTRRHMLVGWRYTSNIGSEPSDMNVFGATRTAWHDVGAQIGSLLIIVNKTYSEDGTIQIRSSDWREPPQVDFRLLSDKRDMDRLVDGIRRVAELHQHAALQRIASRVFPAVWGEKVRQMSANTLKNRLYTKLAAHLLDGPRKVSEHLFRKYVAGKYTLRAVLDDPGLLQEFISTGVSGAWHASASCRMGTSDDPMAVTDAHGRVYGVSGLRIVDASIFPCVPRANTNIPVMMLAEKIADNICGDANGGSS